MGAKNWSNEEVEYLENSWGVVCLESIAKRLKRSKSAVQNKANKLNLGDSRLQGERISLKQFSEATGITNYTIQERWVKAGFKFFRIKQGRFATNKIDLQFFWKWAEKNKKLVNFAKWEKNILGAEPEWVNEKRKADLMNPSSVNWNRKWTKEDEALLIQKTKSGKYTYKDLARDLNRTEAAIKRRLHDLKVPYRPVPLATNIKWTQEEKDKLRNLHEKGFSNASIAKILNKTELAICDRIRNFKSA